MRPVADVMALMRDHYEGTPYDMTHGIDDGSFGTPNRCRPMEWEADGDPGLTIEYLTQYSVGQAEEAVRRWQALGEHLLTTYNDGYVADGEVDSVERGYPKQWLREVVRARPEQFHLEKPEVQATDLPY